MRSEGRYSNDGERAACLKAGSVVTTLVANPIKKGESLDDSESGRLSRFCFAAPHTECAISRAIGAKTDGSRPRMKIPSAAFLSRGRALRRGRILARGLV